MMVLWKRVEQWLRNVLVHRILGVEDTPNRIAWGVFLGFVVGFSPTLGLQILLYVALATLFRVNKISGIPIIFISNPFTAVPLYYFNWQVGRFLLSGASFHIQQEQGDSMRIPNQAHADELDWSSLLEPESWQSLWAVLVNLSLDLWLGSLVMGVFTGIPGYFLTLWAVGRYRRTQSLDPETGSA